jgi:acylphosphatase
VTTAGGPPIRLVAVVHGLVQGVGFRWFVQREATSLSLTGWTANLADGSVEVVAEGSSADLERLEERLREGPSGAFVSGVDVRHEPARADLIDFVIRSGAHRGD